jgi:hypothetical protein
MYNLRLESPAITLYSWRLPNEAVFRKSILIHEPTLKSLDHY